MNFPLLLLSVFFSFHAQASGQSWFEGLEDLKISAQTDEKEIVGIFVAVNEVEGRWFTPEVNESSEDQIWINMEKVKAEVFEFIQAKAPVGEYDVRICFTHTHPRKTIESFYNDPQKRPEIYSESAGPINLERLTISPSRTDISTIYSIDKLFRQDFVEELGGVSERLVVNGLVVDPSGYYYFRPFFDRTEKADLYPELAKNNFAWLDLEEQDRQIKILDRNFFAAKIDWTTHYNHNASILSALRLSLEYQNLQRAYAAHASSVRIRYTDDQEASLEKPCSGVSF